MPPAKIRSLPGLQEAAVGQSNSTSWATSSRTRRIAASGPTASQDRREGGRDRKGIGHLRPQPIHAKSDKIAMADDSGKIDAEEQRADIRCFRPEAIPIHAAHPLPGTLVVACSARPPRRSMGSCCSSVSVIVWGVVGAIYWKIRAASVVVFAHVCGPLLGAMAWAGSACRGSAWTRAWETLLAVGCIAGAILSVGIACTNRLQSRK